VVPPSLPAASRPVSPARCSGPSLLCDGGAAEARSGGDGRTILSAEAARAYPRLPGLQEGACDSLSCPVTAAPDRGAPIQRQRLAAPTATRHYHATAARTATTPGLLSGKLMDPRAKSVQQIFFSSFVLLIYFEKKIYCKQICTMICFEIKISNKVFSLQGSLLRYSTAPAQQIHEIKSTN
jgi:hypothetical protein